MLADMDEDDAFRHAPYWGNIVNQKLNVLIAGQRRLHQHIGFEAEADERRDFKMSAAHDAILAELAAAKTEQEGFLVILKALKDNADNPAKLAEIAQSVKTGRQTWVDAFNEGVEPPPPPPAE